jgi:hypothetical protein
MTLEPAINNLGDPTAEDDAPIRTMMVWPLCPQTGDICAKNEFGKASTFYHGSTFGWRKTVSRLETHE